jgi:hypothetical protein
MVVVLVVKVLGGGISGKHYTVSCSLFPKKILKNPTSALPLISPPLPNPPTLPSPFLLFSTSTHLRLCPIPRLSHFGQTRSKIGTALERDGVVAAHCRISRTQALMMMMMKTAAA